jgi:iron-sulfur cluster assembly accessory protein
VDADVVVTPAAADRVAALLGRAGLAGGGVRVVVQAAGCDGFEALMDLAAGPEPGDVELAAGGVRLFADVASTLRLPGAVLDHVVTASGAEFVWTHPAATGPCACAEADLATVSED